jgi:hypothetical protein
LGKDAYSVHLPVNIKVTLAIKKGVRYCFYSCQMGMFRSDLGPGSLTRKVESYFKKCELNIAACLLKARAGEPEKRPLLATALKQHSFVGNGHETNSETTFAARQHILIRIDGRC